MPFDGDDVTWPPHNLPPEPPPRPRPPARPSVWRPVLMLLTLCGLILFGVWLWSGILFHTPLHNSAAAPRPVTPRGDLSELEKTNIAIYKVARPSVVHITTLALHHDAFRLRALEVPEGTGSGFIWDEDGNVVTNYHVIRNADAARVTLADQSTYNARLVGAAPDRDLAVLRIDAPRSKLRPIVIGSSDDLQVGQMSYAIGNPYGLDQTLTMGIISALGREIESPTKHVIRGVIQTNAAINPGNSGGPLIDSAGRLIGVNTAIYSQSGSWAGIGFAIPVDEVNRVVPQLIRTGKVTRPGIGVQVATDQQAKQLGVDEGVLIVRVLPDSPAAKAGLQPTRQDEEGQIELGDVVTSVDDHPIKKTHDLFDALSKHKSGDTVTLGILRNGKKKMEVQVTLGQVG